MGFSKYFLFLGVTLLHVIFFKQSDANSVLGNRIAKTFAGVKEKFAIKAAFGVDDGNLIMSKASKAIKEIDVDASKHSRNGNLGEAMTLLVDGFKKTINLIAVALNAGIDLINILSKDIKNKEVLINTINNGINEVRTLIFKAGNPVHSRLGAAKSIANITDKGDFKYAIDTIQETGTGLFDDLDSIKYFAIQGINADSVEVKMKCLKAAHAAIISAGEMSNAYLVAGAKKAVEYLSCSDETKISQIEPIEKLISHVTKVAAAADSDTIAALEALDKNFKTHITLGNVAPFMNDLKIGLEEYIKYSAWGIAICYEAIAQARELIKTDPQAAIGMIEKLFAIGKAIIIEGSIKAYEGIGAAGKATGLLDNFEAAIEIVERSRVEGTKGFDSIKTVCERAMVAGGEPADHAFDAAHEMMAAYEAVMFEKLDVMLNLIFKLLKL